MSKRKQRGGKKPNLPQSTLDRARKQLEQDGESDDDEAVEEEAPETAEVAAKASKPAAEKAATTEKSAGEPVASVRRTTRRSERRSSSRSSSSPSRRSALSDRVNFSQRKKRDSLDSETIQDMLANPTRIVTEEELRADYAYVLADLRAMGLLAIGLMILLVALAQFI